MALLENQAAARVPELLPLRYGRIAVSAFAYFRGAALPMANDLGVEGGRPRIIGAPPLIVPLRELVDDGAGPADAERQLRGVLESYRATLEPERRVLLDQYRVVDLARKVVGVGSVGTRSYMAFLLGRRNARTGSAPSPIRDGTVASGAHLRGAMPGWLGRARLTTLPGQWGGEEARSTMDRARYEVRVNGRLSERARSAFCTMDVRPVPAQTIMFGELSEPAELRELLALCSAMGLQVVSLQRLPDC